MPWRWSNRIRKKARKWIDVLCSTRWGRFQWSGWVWVATRSFIRSQQSDTCTTCWVLLSLRAYCCSESTLKSASPRCPNRYLSPKSTTWKSPQYSIRNIDCTAQSPGPPPSSSQSTPSRRHWIHSEWQFFCWSGTALLAISSDIARKSHSARDAASKYASTHSEWPSQYT